VKANDAKTWCSVKLRLNVLLRNVAALLVLTNLFRKFYVTTFGSLATPYRESVKSVR